MAKATATANQELVRDYFTAWDDGDPEAIARFFADDFSTTYTDWTGAEVRIEPDDVHDWIAGWLAVIGDMTHEIHELVASDDTVMAHITYRGVHEGAVCGIEPTNTPVAVEEYLTFHVENGEIVDFDWLSDDLALLRQLGVELPTETEP